MCDLVLAKRQKIFGVLCSKEKKTTNHLSLDKENEINHMAVCTSCEFIFTCKGE